MTRASDVALFAVAAILAAAFASGVSGGGGLASARGPRKAVDGGYFHAGKTPPPSPADRGCGSPGCHAGMPHSRDRAQAAFRNMHLRFADCMVCHGRDSRKSWTVERPAAAGAQASGDAGQRRSRWRIGAPPAAGDRETAHRALGAPLACRACHSEAGQREIAAMGARDLPAGFANPVAVRMIEEGARQWIPDTMR